MTRAKRPVVILLAVLMILGMASPALASGHDETYIDIEILSTEYHPFTDVRYSAWYAQAVQYVWMRNIVGGTTTTTYSPQGNLTRAEVTALIFRMQMGRRATNTDSRTNNFTDVGSEWFAPYVTWAFNNNIVSGTTATTFNPNGRITRQEFATMIYRFATSQMGGMTDSGRQSSQWSRFTDRNQVASWAYNPLRWMNYHGIVTGIDGPRINPNGTATRAEAAMMMMRTVQALGRTINGHGPNVAPRPPAPQQPTPQGIDELTRNGATAQNLLDAGFTHSQIQGAFEREMLRLVNNYRANHGLPAFVLNSQLASVARDRASESLRHQSFTHVSEATGLQHTAHFNRVTGLNAGMAGENLAGGFPTPQVTLNMWLGSDGHRRMILTGSEAAGGWGFNPNYLNRIGIGFDFDFNNSQGFGTGQNRFTMWVSSTQYGLS